MATFSPATASPSGSQALSPTAAQVCAELMYALTHSQWDSPEKMWAQVADPNQLWRQLHIERLRNVYLARGRTQAQQLEVCLAKGLAAAGVPPGITVKALSTDFAAVDAQVQPSAPPPPVVQPGKPPVQMPPLTLPDGTPLGPPVYEDPDRPTGYPPPPGERPQPGGTAPAQSATSSEQLVPIIIVGVSVAIAAGGIGWWLGRKR